MNALGYEMPPELVALLQPGTKLRRRYGLNLEGTEIRHIRGVVDGSMIVYRVWSVSRKRWIYHVDTAYAFYLDWKDGALSRA